MADLQVLKEVTIEEIIKQFNILPDVSEPSGNEPERTTKCRLGKLNPEKYLVIEGFACVEYPSKEHQEFPHYIFQEHQSHKQMSLLVVPIYG